MRKIHILYSEIYSKSDMFVPLLAEEFGLRVVSIGGALRSEIKAKSDLSLKIESYIDNAELIPVDVLKFILQKEIESDNQDVLIYNYPRREFYHEFLDLIKAIKGKIEKVWYLKLVNIEYIVKKEMKKLNEKYPHQENKNDYLLEKIKLSQNSSKELVDMWIEDHDVNIITVNYEEEVDMLTYLKKRIISE